MEDSTKYHNIQRYIQDKKVLYQKLLEYFDPSNNNIEEKYQNLIQVIEDQKLDETKTDLHIFLNFIVKITNNINRSTNFFDKVKKILINIKGKLKKAYSNSEIFNIFSQSKILLLFLLEEQIIAIDSSIARKIHWKSYFAPEIKNFFDVKDKIKLFNKDPKLFEENRHKGENESDIARLIREDLIDEFITYVNKNDFPLNSKIEESIFETNDFLMENEPSLIEYAAFFGSTQIFKYLYKNDVELTESLWIYSIHSNNPEMINILEENEVIPKDNSYIECYYESIKCHHNDMAIYISDNFLDDESKTEDIKIFLKYFNFSFIELDCENNDLFFILCKYNYASLVKLFLETKNVNINFELEIPKINDMCKKKTALISAIEKENIEVVEVLLNNEDIDVNKPKRYFTVDKYNDYQNEETMPPLIIAVMKNNLEIVKLLLSDPKIDVNAKLKIEHEEDDDKQIKTALICAIEKNNEDIVEILLKHPEINANPMFECKVPWDSSYEIKSALCIAIEMGNIEIVKLLLSNNNNINSDQFIKLKYPYEEWHNPTCKTLKSALIIAIDNKNDDIINLLLNCPLINVKYELSCTIEYMSSMSSYIEYKFGDNWNYIMPLIREVLYCPGKKFHLTLDEKMSALCYAIENNLNDIVKILLSSGKFDVNASIIKYSTFYKADEKDRMNRHLFKWSPKAKSIIPALCIAIENNNEEIVKLLLSNPTIDINTKYYKGSYEFNNSYQKEDNDDEDEDDYDYDNDNEDENYWIGKTEKKSPIEIAVKSKNVEIIKLLLQNQKIDLNNIDYTEDDEIRKLFQEKK